MRFTTKLSLMLMLCWLSGFTLQAQPNNDTFGRSRIQFKNFDWKLYSTQNFNVYFYQDGEQAAKNASAYAEQELKRITSFIGYYPYSKVTLILYNSATDLKQSNIGLNSDQFETGGETLFLKNKIELAFNGTQTDFKRDLSYGLTELLLNDMMYGGSLKEALQSSYLLKLPDWFISGVAAYTAEGWSLPMDNFVRDMLVKDPKNGSEQLVKMNQGLAGHAIWNYIAERYGYTSIQNILNLTRITRDVEIGITSSLNIPYKRFQQDWYNYYMQINNRANNPLVSLPENNKLFNQNKKNHHYTEPVLNPAGTLLAYAENDEGSYKIIVQDVKSRRTREVWKSGYKAVDQQIDYKLPVLAWRTNSELGFIEAKKGKMTLRQVSARDRRSRIPFYDEVTTPAATLGDFSQVRDMSYSEDGQSIVVSAVINGQSDLFLLRSNGRVLDRLTNDIFDDINPVFLKNSNKIAFSSNRWIDTTATATAAGFTAVVNNYDIFLLEKTGREANLEQLTSSIASEVRPRATNDGGFIYVSEESGIRSLFKYDMATGRAVPFSNFYQNIENFDYNATNNTLAVTANDLAKSFVYLFPDFEATALDTLPKTSRQIILETRARNPSLNPANSSRRLLENNNRRRRTQRTDGEVNIENYEFNSDQAQEATQNSNAGTTQRRASGAGNSSMAGPIDYDLRFSVQEIVTTVYSDPLYGFGIVAGVNMSDLFENHTIRGQAFLRTSDLKTSRIFGEYMNRSHRFNMGFQYRRDVIYGSYYNLPDSYVWYGKNEISPVLVYPLTYSTSLRAQPRFANTRFTYINNFPLPDSVNNFWGGNLELVFDNSIVKGVNMLEGTRFKVGVMTMKSFSNSAVNFNKFYFDFRRYQKLHRQITLATRLSYGAFFGNAPKSYLIGGMDNWLFASQAEDNERNDITIGGPADLLYMEYIMPMRGFNFNARNGSKHLLANIELRVPIVQYLYDGPIPSGFFRNLQFTGFFDAGSAYDGINPFSGNNSINTRIVGGESTTGNNPFEITVINYRNPFLMGYGVGARSSLFGVYGKLDVAWSQDDDIFNVTTESRRGPKFYVTLGYDF
ncbi:hypothetical protein [Pontibacter sp. SGAir0037]|uniref:hypothetical protein n=1 Tax=Pontibacter sp. SGAir0037 TaxID=2571030 RepID=UPI0010CD2533|nr:hypothetical protein [Pontibacter sp. SGAir0037]QCR24402.1 hypothetical protein C1N53_19935 [Pontibacter sp. SGAir0037]